MTAPLAVVERSSAKEWADFRTGEVLHVNIQRCQTGAYAGAFGIRLNDRNAITALDAGATEAIRRSLRVGDVVVAVDGKPLRANEMATALTAEMHQLQVLRGWTATL